MLGKRKRNFKFSMTKDQVFITLIFAGIGVANAIAVGILALGAGAI